MPELSCGFIVPMQKNGRGSGVALLADRDDVLLHRLEQRGLHARRRAVELVEHDGVREDRARDELVGAESRVRRLDHLADDAVGRQVARALDARVVAADGARDDPGERRLADAGDVLDQQVAVGEQAAQRQGGGRSISTIAPRISSHSACAVSRASISTRSSSEPRPLAARGLTENYRRKQGALESPERGRAPRRGGVSP